jgi:hypothetical protein
MRSYSSETEQKCASQIKQEWRTRCSVKHNQFHVQHSSVGRSVTLHVLVRVHPQLFRSVVQSLAIFCSGNGVVIRRYQMTVYNSRHTDERTKLN